MRPDRRGSVRKNAGLYVMILPVVTYFLLFCYWPMYGVLIAFKDYSPLLGVLRSPWLGLEHFRSFFSSYYIGRLLVNTIGISFYWILLSAPAPVVLALMFNEVRRRRLRQVLQTVSYAPSFISVTVMCAMVAFFLNPGHGVLNAIIQRLGGKPVNPIADSGSFWHIYVWSGLWQYVGWDSLTYTAVMAGIDPQLYEAATVDGAGKLRRMVHVTIPSILPAIVILGILKMGTIMTGAAYEKVLLLQNDLNLPASEVIGTYIYKRGLLHAEYGFSTAVGLFNNVVNFLMLVATNLLARRIGETSLW